MLRQQDPETGHCDIPPDGGRSPIRQVWMALESGNLEAARRICEQLLELDQTRAEAWHLAALIAYRTGDSERSVEALARAVQCDPDNPQYHNDLGVIFRALGRFNEAGDCYRTAIRLSPRDPHAHSNLAVILRLQGNFGAAIRNCREAIRLSPQAAGGYFNLALTYQAMGLSAEAISAYRRNLELNPNHAVAWHNLGSALLNQNSFDQAGGCFERALSLKQDYAEAYNGLSNVRRIEKKPAESIALAQKALKLKPGFADALAHAAVLYQQVCAWIDLRAIEPQLTSQTRSALEAGSQPSETPLFAVGFRQDPGINSEIARAWSRQIEQRANRLNIRFDFSQRHKTDGRITIGYLSSDFRDHPVAHQIMALPSAHAQSDFRIICYSAGTNDDSLYRRHLESACDKFVDVRDLTDPEAARQIYDDGVDILVDLNGHTAGNRLGVCALRPAPVQATYLGFPGTSGASFFDYIITDRLVTPEAHLRYYAEQPVYLPGSYMITDDSQPISARPSGRQAAGLPETGFIFCSFNSAFKFEPILFEVWMSILRQVPESCLWLPDSDNLVRRAISKAAAASGIQTERIIFAPKLASKADHLARLGLADMALDTRIYNGHVSTCDALWAGVPVLTLAGTHFASRVSSSILSALDVREMITGSKEEYVATAVHFASNREDYKRLRTKLARHRLSQLFFNTARMVHHLEIAYKAIWRKYRKGEPPSRIDIDAAEGPV